VRLMSIPCKNFTSRRKFLATPVAAQAGKGSFDSAAASHLRSSYSAQDDRVRVGAQDDRVRGMLRMTE